MRVCQYLINDHPLYLRMAANSVAMLREHNGDIPVRLLLVRDGGRSTATTNHRGGILAGRDAPDVDAYVDFYRRHGVEVAERSALEVPGEEGFFHIHRSLLASTPEDSLLFIDADTFVFGDVGELFDRYSGYDYVGLPIAVLDGWDPSWLPFRPYNSAVNLWNGGWVRRFAAELPDWCRRLREGHRLTPWAYGQCRRGTNREELSTSLFVAERGLRHVTWEREDVINSSSIVDYDRPPGCRIFHAFTHNWRRGLRAFRGGGVKFKRRLFRPA